MRSPDLRTLPELGYPLEAAAWWALIAPAGTPEAIVTRLRAEIGKALLDNEVRDKIAGISLQALTMEPAEFNAVIRSDYAKYGKLVKDIGATVD